MFYVKSLLGVRSPFTSKTLQLAFDVMAAALANHNTHWITMGKANFVTKNKSGSSWVSSEVLGRGSGEKDVPPHADLTMHSVLVRA